MWGGASEIKSVYTFVYCLVTTDTRGYVRAGFSILQADLAYADDISIFTNISFWGSENLDRCNK